MVAGSLGKGTESAAGMISAELGAIVGYFDSHVCIFGNIFYVSWFPCICQISQGASREGILKHLSIEVYE